MARSAQYDHYIRLSFRWAMGYSLGWLMAMPVVLFMIHAAFPSWVPTWWQCVIIVVLWACGTLWAQARGQRYMDRAYQLP